MKSDPQGKRTLGVVTKTDMVSADSDILAKIRMDRDNDIRLALGYIAVRNRSPSELGKLTHAEALQKEKQLFETGFFSQVCRNVSNPSTLVLLMLQM